MPPNGEGLITPGRGGKVTVDRVTVEFPAGAVDRDMTLRVSVRAPAPSPKYARLAYVFDVDARQGTSPQGARVSRFRRPPIVTIRFKDLGLSQDEERRSLFWHHDEGTGRWKPLIPRVNRAAGTATVQVPHFSGIGFGPPSGSPVWAPPSLEAYQTSLLTGASQAGYSIDVPPGMGGLTPKVELSYSSMGVDELNKTYAKAGNFNADSFSKQASWVGLGWDLEPGCILTPVVDGQVNLRVGGRGSRLVQTGGTDGSWRTEDEWFWKVVFVTPALQQGQGGSYPDTSNISEHYWLAWDKEGTEYRFGFTVKSEHTIGGGYPYRYDLDRVKDTRGNYIEYIWEEQTDNASGSVYDCDRDFWLKAIRYTGNGSVNPGRTIMFRWGPSSGYRSDCVAGDEDHNYVHRRYLEAIEVYSDYYDAYANPPVEPTQLVSKYVLGHTYIYPWWHEDQSDTQSQSNYSLMLTSITRYGADGASTLPATTFNYYQDTTDPDPPSPHTHWKPWLWKANNGFGGRAVYKYQFFQANNWEGLKYRGRVTSRKLEDTTITGNQPVESTYSYSTAYEFNDPWNGEDRSEFRGHDQVDETDSLEHYGSSFFYTWRASGNTQNGKSSADIHVLKGRTYKQERRQSGGTLLAYEDMSWDYIDTGSDSEGDKSYFIKLVQQDSYLGSKHKKAEYIYDNTYGNVLREYYNQNITGEPQKTVRRAFYADTARWLIGQISWERVFSGIVTAEDGQLPSSWAKFTAWGYSSSHDVFHTDAQITNGLVYRVRNYYKDQSQQEQSILTQYGYDNYGNRNSVTDPNSKTTTSTFDSTYNTFVTRVDYPISGLWEQRGYDLGRGLLTSINDSNHNPPTQSAISSYAYDTFGRIKAVAAPGDSLELNQGKYDKATQGFVYYDTISPVCVLTTTRKVASGSSAPYDYHTARVFYDGLGRVVQRYSDGVNASGNNDFIVANTHYNSRGLKEWESVPRYLGSDPGGYFASTAWGDSTKPRTQFVYDALRRPITVTNPDSTYRQTAYRGWEVTSTDEKRHQKKQTMDAFGRLVRIDEYTNTFTEPNPDATPYATTDYAYDVLNNLITVTDAYNQYSTPTRNVTTMVYNALARKIEMTDPDMGNWKYEYDGNGNLVRQEDARHKVVRFGYDAMNRLKRKTYWRMNGSQEVHEENWVDELSINNTVGIYDIAEIRAVVNANLAGQESTDSNKRPRLVWSGLQGETDPNDRTFIAGRTTIRGIHFTEMRDAERALKDAPTMDFQKGTIDPNNPGNRAIYLDDAKNLRDWLTQYEANDTRRARAYYRYDSYSDGESRGNPKGRRTEMWDASGHTRWTYDHRGRVTKEERWIDAAYYKTEWTYDAIDRVLSVVYPGTSGETINCTYNRQMLLQSMTGASSYITGVTYNQLGQPTRISLGSGWATDMKYCGLEEPTKKPFGALSWMKTFKSGETDLQRLDYNYDDAGNVTQVNDERNSENMTYTYDDLDRLLKRQLGGVDQETFEYDNVYNRGDGKWGNIVKKNNSTFTYGTSKPHAVTNDGTLTYVYDDNGNMTERGTNQYMKYDVENRPCKVTSDSGGTQYVARFTYDGDGRRAKRVDNYGTIHYAGPHYERNVGNGVDTSDTVTKYYYAQLGAQRRLIALNKGGTLTYVHTDHLGGTSMVSGASGTEVGDIRYNSFGSTRVQTGTIPTDKRYTGQTLDASTGLYDYGARYYDSYLNRWIQPDTIVPRPGNPQSLNRYSYGLNNPLRYTDPTGHSEEGPGYAPEEGYFYVFVGGYGTNDQVDHSEWTPMITNLGLKPGQYTYFNWDNGCAGSEPSKDRRVEGAAQDLSSQIAGRKNVVLVGHSKGGALIMEYLAEVAEGNPAVSANPNVKYAFTIDSPIGGEGGSSYIKFRRYEITPGTLQVRDRLENLPERLASKGMAVDLTTLVNPNNISGHDPIPGASYRSVPLGSSLAGHTYDIYGVHGLLMTSSIAAGVIYGKTWGAPW